MWTDAAREAARAAQAGKNADAHQTGVRHALSLGPSYEWKEPTEKLSQSDTDKIMQEHYFGSDYSREEANARAGNRYKR